MSQIQSRRDFLKTAGTTTLALGASALFPTGCLDQPKTPNILIVLTDQLRWSALGCYGNPDVRTPTLDQMASEGVRFSSCVSVSPVCAPFRCTLQTGLYPHQHGVVKNNMHLDQSLKSMADYFIESGYTTGYIGKAHWYSDDKPGYIPPGERLRWQYWHGHNRGHYHFDTPTFDPSGTRTHDYKGTYEPHVQTDLAIDFIRRNRNRRWALQLNWGPPHNATMDRAYQDPLTLQRLRHLNRELGFGLPEDIFTPRRLDDPRLVGRFPQHLVDKLLPQRYLDLYSLQKLILQPNVEPGMARLARYFYLEYYAMVTSLDEQLASLRQALGNMGLDRETIIVFTSDHGDMLGSHGVIRGKGKPYQNAYRTPLLVWGPDWIESDTVVDAPLNSVDLLPTILDLAGIRWDPDLPGKSQADWCRGVDGERQADVLLGYGDWRAVFDGRYFYALRAEQQTAIPVHLIDTQNDPFDLDNLLMTVDGQDMHTTFHDRLIQSLKAVNDHEFLDRIQSS
jgi:arylsulfatase A-like enzyme